MVNTQRKAFIPPKEENASFFILCCCEPPPIGAPNPPSSLVCRTIPLFPIFMFRIPCTVESIEFVLVDAPPKKLLPPFVEELYIIPILFIDPPPELFGNWFAICQCLCPHCSHNRTSASIVEREFTFHDR